MSARREGASSNCWAFAMRYKVKMKNLETFRKARSLVAAEACVFVASEGRLVLSTSELSFTTRAKLTEWGARVVPDMQFHADAA